MMLLSQSRKIQFTPFLLLALGALLLTLQQLNPASRNVGTTTALQFDGLPLFFIPTEESSARSGSFTTRGPSGVIQFTEEGVTFGSGDKQAIQYRFVDQAPEATLDSDGQLSALINDYGGASNWRERLPASGALAYRSLYPGIDLRYEGQDGRLKSTFTVAPGADPRVIAWKYEGAEAIAINRASGALEISGGQGAFLSEAAPQAWQEVDGRNLPVKVTYELRGADTAGFALGNYDRALPLIIDPTIVYESSLDAAESEYGLDIAVDESGNAFVLAYAYRSARYQGNYIDALLARFNPNGGLDYATFLGGNNIDIGTGIALDPAGNVVLAGFTDSEDFPLLDAIKTSKNVTRDAFLARLSGVDGTLLYSSYFGGSRSDSASDVALNSAGEIYLIGQTESTDFPIANPLQPGLNLSNCFCDDAFVSKLSADGQQVLYGTYLGGGRDDYGKSIALDAADNVYIVGETRSSDFPTLQALQAQPAGGERDLFVAALGADGTSLLYSSYLGGSDVDSVARLDVDDNGHAYLTGSTRSADFPTTAGAFQEQFAGGINACGGGGFNPSYNCEDIFVSKLAADGSQLAYSTFIAGQLQDVGRGIAVNESGEAHVVGWSNSGDFPGGSGADLDTQITAVRLSASGSDLLYTVQVNSPSANSGHGIALGPDGDAYITGAQNVPRDTYVARISATAAGDPAPSPTPTAEPLPTATPPAPTPTATSEPTTVHSADLDGQVRARRGQWRARVTVVVHDADHNPVADATVSGSWSGGFSGLGACVTNGSGQCNVNSGTMSKAATGVTFTIDTIEDGASRYAPGDNHDPDLDSDGTTITITQP